MTAMTLAFGTLPLLLAGLAAAQPVSLEPDPPRPADLNKVEELLAIPAPAAETAPRFSPDSRRLLYQSTAGGSPALLLRDLGAGAPPTKVPVTLPKRFRRPGFSPEPGFVHFTSDDAGDEAYSLYRLNLQSGQIEALTPGEKLRRDGPWYARRGKSRFFTARKMSERGLFLYEQRLDVEDSAPALVFQSDELSFAAMRRDGAQILATANPKSDALLSVDLTPGAVPKRLWPEEARDVRIFGVAYAPTGDRIYVATDDGGEHCMLLALSPKSGRVLARYREEQYPTADIQELQVGGDRVAFILDAGTRHDVRILNAKTLKPIVVEPPLPIGSETPGARHPNITGGFDLSPDGSRIAVQWSTATSAPHIQLIDTRTGKRTRLTEEESTSASDETKIVNIPTHDTLTVPTLLYLPPEAATKRLPVIVQIHGGFPFASTARFDPGLSILLDEGYAVVEPNVRGSGGFGRAFETADDGMKKLDAFRDLGAVARWVAAQPWADPKRLILMGRSAGGYYTLIGLEHDPDIWRCGVAVVPMFDVLESVRSTDGDLREFWENKELVPLSEPMLLDAISPSLHIARLKAPLFLFAAVRDARAPLEQIESLVRVMRERRAIFEYMRSPEGHSLADAKLRAGLTARTLRFLRDNCGP